MGFKPTVYAQDKANGTVLQPSIVLEIDGYDRVFGIGSIKKYTRVGDIGLVVDGSWVIGGYTTMPNADDFISLDGTTTSISQQMEQDKGGTTNVSSIQIALIDKDEKITRLISPGVEVTDILGRKAWVYLGFQDTAWPEDYILVFNGIIDEITSAGNIIINVAHPEQNKRQDIFITAETEVNGAFASGATTITLNSTTNFLLPVASIFTTYVKINDEIIRYTGISGNNLTGCTRAQFGTIAAAISDDDSVSSFYRLQGDAIDLALQLMLSSPDQTYFLQDYDVTNFVRSASGVNTANSLFFVAVDLTTKWGIAVGDFITTTGASTGANNFSLRQITSIQVTLDGTIITVDGAALVLELDTAAVASFKSQYNVLPDGLGLGGDQVDVAGFQDIKSTYFGVTQTYDFYLTETVKAKDFIDKELLFPSNYFTLPRKAKISVGVVSPPLAVATLPVLDKDSITNSTNLKIKRSIGKYFYNTAIYKYNFDAVETDKALTGYIRVDDDSRAQIPVGTKAITVISKGLRNNADTTAILDNNSVRLLEKYKFAAEAITISGFYGKLFNVDIGDVVLFGDTSMPIVDSKFGQRGFEPRLCEIIDKKMDIKTGRVDVTIIDTSYSTDGRYGIFSPASIIGTGSTTSQLVLTQSYNTGTQLEKNKWVDYIGLDLLIHNDDWTTQYSTTLLGFDTDDPTLMNITVIGGAPTAGMIVCTPNYPSNTDPEDDLLYKNIFVYTDPKVDVTAGIDDFSFTVGAGDIGKFLVGAQFKLHNPDWSIESPEVRVASISGNDITTDISLGFTPDNTYDAQIIGFVDGGAGYRFL